MAPSHTPLYSGGNPDHVTFRVRISREGYGIGGTESPRRPILRKLAELRLNPLYEFGLRFQSASIFVVTE